MQQFLPSPKRGIRFWDMFKGDLKSEKNLFSSVCFMTTPNQFYGNQICPGLISNIIYDQHEVSTVHCVSYAEDSCDLDKPASKSSLFYMFPRISNVYGIHFLRSLCLFLSQSLGPPRYDHTLVRQVTYMVISSFWVSFLG